MLLGHFGYYIVAVPRDEEAHLFEVKKYLLSEIFLCTLLGSLWCSL
jgi:hypothetical protein